MINSPTRSEFITGLRALADLLEAHDDLPLPYEGAAVPINWHFLSGPNQRANLAAFVRTVGGSFDKQTFDSYFGVTGSIEGLKVSGTAYRDVVCTRIVTGTREVTEQVPDPDALAAVPTTTVTRTEDVVDWVCEPLLADREQVTA